MFTNMLITTTALVNISDKNERNQDVKGKDFSYTSVNFNMQGWY